jgi:hypothetical protein
MDRLVRSHGVTGVAAAAEGAHHDRVECVADPMVASGRAGSVWQSEACSYLGTIMMAPSVSVVPKLVQ